MRWSGNIRELRNVVERLIILSPGKITEKEVSAYVMPSATQNHNKYKEIFDKFEDVRDLKVYIEKEYEQYKAELV